MWTAFDAIALLLSTYEHFGRQSPWQTNRQVAKLIGGESAGLSPF